ncbi:TRAP transporter small permease [Acuticoccus sp. M5D2P5]|uniref:TRAP transporter small permease n=1 Tax=Acuticoccus kalidii TaxID=2910977 RepID=UPI001F29A3A7|nr:TRAP transporter small permease [Acuticoccus kalidii]MCF3936528.1 TRAP transporter small permease [Acuticoccus kalidii]
MHLLCEGLYRLLRVVLTLLMALLIVPVTMQILSRYSGYVPRYIWTEEIARLCFVWIIMVGAMIAVRDWTHFEVDLLPRPENPKFALTLQLIPIAAVGLAGITFVYFGIDFAKLGMRQRSEISGLPMLYIYGAWPLAGVIWLLFIAEKIGEVFSTYRLEKRSGTG